MSPSNVYRHSRIRLIAASAALLVAGVAFWLSKLPIDHVYGSVALALGAIGLAYHFLRPPLELTITPDGLSVSGRLISWSEVNVSEIKERMRKSMRYPIFEVMVKDPARDTGRRTIEVHQIRWPRFDELYDALCVHARAASHSKASK